MADTQEQSQQLVPMTINDLIYAHVKDLGNRMDRLENRMDKFEDKLDATRKELNARIDKQDEKIEKLANKIDDLRKDITSSSNHGNIMTASVIGIALTVIYAVFIK